MRSTGPRRVMRDLAALAARVALAAQAALALAACEGDARVHVPLPPLSGAVESWVIARDTAPPHLYAADEHAPLVLPLDGAPMTLELAGFTQSLAVLDLAAGAVPAAAGAGRALPDPLVSFAITLDASGEGAWRAVPSSPLVAAARVPGASPCRELHAETGALPMSSPVTWAVSLDADTLLIGTGDGGVVRFTLAAGPVVVPTARAPGAPPFSPRGGFRDARGRLFIGDRDGGLWEASDDGRELRLERRVPATPHGGVNALDGDPQDPEAQLFAMTSSGAVARWAGDRWSSIDQLPSTPHPDNNNTVVWMGRDHLIAGTSGWAGVRVIQGDLRQDITADCASDVAITGISRLGPGEAVVALSGGCLTRYSGGEWRSLGRGAITLDVHVFHRDRGDGFLYAGAFGYVGEWLPSIGFCPVAPGPIAGATVHYVLPVGDALWLAGDRKGTTTVYTLLGAR